MTTTRTKHNVVHIVSGLLALFVARVSPLACKRYFQIFGTTYALLGVIGLGLGSSLLRGFIAHNTADAWLHIVIGLGCVAVAHKYSTAQRISVR